MVYEREIEPNSQTIRNIIETVSFGLGGGKSKAEDTIGGGGGLLGGGFIRFHVLANRGGLYWGGGLYLGGGFIWGGGLRFIYNLRSTLSKR